jgi:hypothetical protein
MDNTLTDDFGDKVRPGIKVLLQRLISEGDTLILWTNSTVDRANDILEKHNLNKYFTKFLFREDYIQNRKSTPKDIRRVNGDFIIYDDPMQVELNKSNGKNGFLTSSYQGRSDTEEIELELLYKSIMGVVRGKYLKRGEYLRQLELLSFLGKNQQ